MNSMTGFGAACAPLKNASLRIEICSVNRKQAEIVVYLPRLWAELESSVRDFIASRISRGRVSVSITLATRGDSSASCLTINREKLQSLTERLSELNQITGQTFSPSLDNLLRLGILVEENAEDSTSAPEAWEHIEPLLEEAMQAFLAMRSYEGANLKRDLLSRIDTLRDYRRRMGEQAAGVAEQHKQLLMQRLAERDLPLALDDERLVKEIAFFADKCDVSEELTRLDSHLCQFEKICNSSEPVGRSLDFLCQEIFRELNTTGSKANNATLAQSVVAAKTELEKIREQVQNVE